MVATYGGQRERYTHDGYGHSGGDPNDLKLAGGLYYDEDEESETYHQRVDPRTFAQDFDGRRKGTEVDKRYVHAISLEDKTKKDHGEIAARLAMDPTYATRKNFFKASPNQESQLLAMGWNPEVDGRQALFAQMAYGPQESDISKVQTGLLMSGLSMRGWKVDTTFTNDMMVVFHNDFLGEVNIAFRGSTMGDQAFEDWVGVNGGDTMMGMRDWEDALEAAGVNARLPQYNRIEQALMGVRSTYGDGSITHLSGHSRGGYEASYWARKFDLPNAQVDVFNAPTSIKDHTTKSGNPILHWNSKADPVHDLLSDSAVRELAGVGKDTVHNVETRVGPENRLKTFGEFIHSIGSITGLKWDKRTGLLVKLEGIHVESPTLDNALGLVDQMIAATEAGSKVVKGVDLVNDKVGKVVPGKDNNVQTDSAVQGAVVAAGVAAAALRNKGKDADGSSAAANNLMSRLLAEEKKIADNTIIKMTKAVSSFFEVFSKMPAELLTTGINVVKQSLKDKGVTVPGNSGANVHFTQDYTPLLRQNASYRQRVLTETRQAYLNGWDARWQEVKELGINFGLRLPMIAEQLAMMEGVSPQTIDKFKKALKTVKDIKDGIGVAYTVKDKVDSVVEEFVKNIGLAKTQTHAHNEMDPDFADLNAGQQKATVWQGLTPEMAAAWEGIVIEKDVESDRRKADGTLYTDEELAKRARIKEINTRGPNTSILEHGDRGRGSHQGEAKAFDPTGGRRDMFGGNVSLNPYVAP